MGRKGKAECFLLNLFLRPRLPDLRRPVLAWWLCGSFESIFQLFVVGVSVFGYSVSLVFFKSWEQIAHQVVSEGHEQNAFLRWKTILCVRLWFEAPISCFRLM